LYILGDMIDRGPDSMKLLLFIMEHDNMHCLKGNHEDMFLDILNLNARPYDPKTYLDFRRQTIKNQISIIKYLEGLPLMFEVDKYILVHAGINVFDRSWEDLRIIQKPDDLLWIRDSFYENRGVPDKIIIFGHTPTIVLHNKSKIWFDPIYHDKIGIDCGAAFKKYGGKLACLNLDNMKTFYTN